MLYTAGIRKWKRIAPIPEGAQMLQRFPERLLGFLPITLEGTPVLTEEVYKEGTYIPLELM
jgi:hypothetical protein